MREGAIGHFTVWENLLLTDYDSTDYLRYGLFDFGAIRDHTATLVEDFDIRTPSLETPGGTLSGGNIQKLIISREISAEPKVLLASQPTRGVDIGAAEYIHKRLIDQRDRGSDQSTEDRDDVSRVRGTAILMISEDLDEIFGLSDRIAVMYEGRIMAVLDPANATRAEVGLLMAGVAGDVPAS
jgi:simple sugar transport system ATP-binding protein